MFGNILFLRQNFKNKLHLGQLSQQTEITQVTWVKRNIFRIYIEARNSKKENIWKKRQQPCCHFPALSDDSLQLTADS